MFPSSMCLAATSDSRAPTSQMPTDGPVGSPSSVVSTGNVHSSHVVSHFLFVCDTADMCTLCLCVSVCVYVNKHGICGPHLDRKQVQRLPDHFGPEAVNLVLQQTVQACLDCAYQPKVLLGCLQSQGGGGEVVRGAHQCFGVNHMISNMSLVD